MRDDEIEEWLRPCGSCDAGLAMDCTCPHGDPRGVIADLWDELGRLRADNERLGTEVLKLRRTRPPAPAVERELRSLRAELAEVRQVEARHNELLADANSSLRAVVDAVRALCEGDKYNSLPVQWVRAALGATTTQTSDDESGQPCPASANQRGEHIPCDERSGHDGWAHSNREHGLIWNIGGAGASTEEPAPTEYEYCENGLHSIPRGLKCGSCLIAAAGAVPEPTEER